jgi:hypothetical protein
MASRLHRLQTPAALPANYMTFSEDYTKFTWLTGGTGAAIPHIYSAGTTLAVGTKVTVPDIPGGEVGKGFTCTGLTVDPDNGNLWVGNFGSTRGGAGGNSPPISIVQMTPDGASMVSQIILPTQGIGGLQGIAFVSTGGLKCLAYVGGADNRIRFVNRDGSIPRPDIQLPFTANALTWDPQLGGLWVGDANSPMGYLVGLDGVQRRAVDFNFSGFSSPMDHFCVDASRGTGGYLWGTCGANGAPGVVFVYDKDKDVIVNRYLLDSAQAVEGLVVQGTVFKTVSDGYYHSTGSAPNTTGAFMLNELQTYTVPSTIPAWRHARVYRASDMVGPNGSTPMRLLLDRGDGDTSADFCFVTRQGDVAANAQVANLAVYAKSADPAVTANLGLRLLSGASAVNFPVGAAYSRPFTSATYANGANDCQFGTRGAMTPDRIVNVTATGIALNLGASAVAYNPRLGA